MRRIEPDLIPATLHIGGGLAGTWNLAATGLDGAVAVWADLAGNGAWTRLSNANSFSISAGAPPSRDTCFPIVDDTSKFSRRLKNALNGASADAIRAVEAIKPYPGGNERIVAIHALEKIDKHRLLLGAGAALNKITFPSPFIDPTQAPPGDTKCTGRI